VTLETSLRKYHLAWSNLVNGQVQHPPRDLEFGLVVLRVLAASALIHFGMESGPPLVRAMYFLLQDQVRRTPKGKMGIEIYEIVDISGIFALSLVPSSR